MTLRELKRLIDKLPDELLDVKIVKTSDYCANMIVNGAYMKVNYSLDSQGNPHRDVEFIID